MSITLPPLPRPDAVTEIYTGHGYKDVWTAATVRARDMEIVRLVLEGAKGALVQASIEAKRGTDRAVLTAAAIIVRALEVRHHE